MIMGKMKVGMEEEVERMEECILVGKDVNMVGNIK